MHEESCEGIQRQQHLAETFSPGKEPYEETDNQEERPDEKMQKLKDEEEHVDSTLHTGN